MRSYLFLFIILLLNPLGSKAQKVPAKVHEVAVINTKCLVPKGEDYIKQLNSVKPIAAAPLSTKAANAEAAKRKARVNPNNYPKPTISVKIKLQHEYISNFNDLRFTLTVKNETNSDQTFLFDKYDGKSATLFETTCNILNSNEKSVVKHTIKALMDTATYYKNINSYYYTLKPKEWLMKEYSVSHLVFLDTVMCKKGRLPHGTYKLQINMQDNPSNIVSFVAD
jgi:hypothetical protein